MITIKMKRIVKAEGILNFFFFTAGWSIKLTPLLNLCNVHKFIITEKENVFNGTIIFPYKKRGKRVKGDRFPLLTGW